ncbi:MAG: hypothetical protein ACRYG8_09885, partial [Janthinobacterium lividum]
QQYAAGNQRVRLNIAACRKSISEQQLLYSSLPCNRGCCFLDTGLLRLHAKYNTQQMRALKRDINQVIRGSVVACGVSPRPAVMNSSSRPAVRK